MCCIRSGKTSPTLQSLSHNDFSPVVLRYPKFKSLAPFCVGSFIGQSTSGYSATHLALHWELMIYEILLRWGKGSYVHRQELTGSVSCCTYPTLSGAHRIGWCGGTWGSLSISCSFLSVSLHLLQIRERREEERMMNVNNTMTYNGLIFWLCLIFLLGWPGWCWFPLIHTGQPNTNHSSQSYPS